jgi:hypothetical protein
MIVMNQTLLILTALSSVQLIPLNDPLKMLSGEDRGYLLTDPINYPIKMIFSHVRWTQILKRTPQLYALCKIFV